MSFASPYETIPSISIPELIIKYLQLEGVDHIFGIPGGSFPDLLAALKPLRATLPYIVARHETGAAYMADGYHRASGKLGVVLVTSGPGATNALTGAMNAQAGMTSMLVITGEQPQSSFGLDWEQEGVDLDLDVLQVYKSAVAYSAMTPNTQDFDVLFRQALRIAQGRPGQAAHLSIPHDIMASTATNVRFPNSPSLYRATFDACAPADVQMVADALAAAQRPMILLGNGSRDALGSEEALAQFVAMVERFSIPVGTTADAKALFPESHALALRNCGYPSCTWPGLYFSPPTGSPDAAPFDCLIVLGSSMGDFATNLWDAAMVPAGPFIQVDANSKVIGRSMPITRGVIAELGAFIPALAAVMQERKPGPSVKDRTAYLEWMKKTHSAYADPEARESDATPIRPERAMAIVSEMLPPGSHVFPDAGNTCGWTATYLELDPPSRMHAALDVGAMGYATAAVVGAKLADPSATCLSIGGDGSFLMHGAEVTTACQYGVGPIWMVWNENDLNMVTQSMAAHYPAPGWDDYYALGNPDLVKVAEGFGAEAYLVHSPADLKDSLARAIDGGQKGRPQVIVVREDASARPPFNFPSPQKA
ncbi:MAG: thiamine pyrophosphate-binding protein [Gemmatimonadaceae bacterium]